MRDERSRRMLRPRLECLEVRPLMSYPAIVLPSYVYGYANLGGNVAQQAALLNTQVTPNGVFVGEQANGLVALDDATTGVNFDDNNSGDSTTASLEIDTVTDNSDGEFSGATATGYTTDSSNPNSPAQNFIPVKIEPSDGSVDGQNVSITLSATYQNKNIVQTTGSNTYAVEYQVGDTPVTMMKATDSQMPPPPPSGLGPLDITRSASFTATVGETFYVFMYLSSTTDDGAPSAGLSLDITESAQGGGGGGGAAPTAANYSYSAATGQALQIAAPGLFADDSDPSGLPLQVESFTSPSHGSLTVYADGAFDYLPDAGFAGKDSFTYTIEDSADLTATGTVTVTVQPASLAATHWVISQFPPSSVSVGSPFGLTVEAEDAAGDVATSFNGLVTVSLANTDGATEPLSGITAVDAQSGKATFSGLSVSQPGIYTLSISGGGLSGTAFLGFVVTEPAATHWIFSEFPAGLVTAGSPLGFQVEAQDNNGNLVSSFNNGPAIALLSSSNDPSPNGLSLGVATVGNGRATFSGLTVSTPGTYTLWITGGGLNPTSFSVVVVSVSVPAIHPTVTTAQLLEDTVVTGRGRHLKKRTKFAGFELTFNEALNPDRALNGLNYQALQTTMHGRKISSKPVLLLASYNASNYTLSLSILGKAPFTKGGELILNASGITDTSGDSMIGNTVFTILAHARGIIG
jgi:Bacterial Ig domain